MVFSEDVTGFVAGDIAVSGTASGDTLVPSNFAGIGNSYTFEVAAASNGVITVSIPKLVAADTAGNSNLASTAYAVSVTDAAPVVTAVSAREDGTYNTDDTVDIIITFDESVRVFGTPQLLLETGIDDAVVNYTDGSPGTELTFTYTVGATHGSDDLNYVDADSLTLNTGAIVANDDLDIPANRKLPATGSDNSLGGTSDVIVVVDAPTVLITSTATHDGGTTNSRIPSYTVTFSEDVTGFDNVMDDITVTGTATATASALTRVSSTVYTFIVTADSDGTVIVSVPAGAARDHDTIDNKASATHTITIGDISQTPSVELPANGYRHNLVHLTGDYYVSSHTVTAPSTATPDTTLDSKVTLRLYSIIDGIIELIDSEVIQTNTQNRDIQLDERNTEPKSTGLTRVDDDTIAVSYVDGDTTSSTVATYDVDTASTTMMPFTLSQSADFRTGTTGDQTHNHTLIAFDENRLVIAYSYPDSDPTGFIQVISIAPGDGGLAAGTAVPTTDDQMSTTDDQGLYNSMVKLDDDTVVLAYRGEDARGYLNTFGISDDSNITARVALEHDTGMTAYHSLIRVDGDTVAVAYSVLGPDTSPSEGYGQIRVFDIDSDNDISVRGEGSTVYQNTAADTTFEEHAHLNSMALLDSDTLAVAYRGDNAGGFIRLYDINHLTGDLNATAGPYAHDTAVGAFNSLVRIDDGTLALVYGGDLPDIIRDSTATPNRIKTLSTVVDDTPPVIESAGTTNATTIVLVASQSLVEGTADTDDFAVSDNTVIGTPRIFGSTITITVGTAIVGGNTVTMNYTGITITDVAGNALEMSTFLPVRNNVTDDTAPTVTITSTAATNGGTTNSRIIYYTAVFSEEVTGFDVAAVIVETGTATRTVSELAGSGTTYTFTVTTTTDGTVEVTIPAGAAADAAGNVNTESDTYAVRVVNAGPTVTGVSANSGAYKEGGVIDITITFDEQVTVVDTDGSPTLTLETGDSDAVVAYHSSPSGTELLFRYTVAAGHNSVDLQYVDSDPLALNGGTILVAGDNTPASLALPGIASAASLAGGSDVIVDTIAPILDSATAVNFGFEVDIVFTEPVFGNVTNSQFRVSHADVRDSEVNDLKIKITVLPLIKSNSQTLNYTGSFVTDAAGNPAAQFHDELITNPIPDTDRPSPLITSSTVSNGGITNSRMLSYSVEFFEVVTDFAASNIELSGTAAATATVDEPTADNFTRYNFVVTAPMDGTLTVSIPADEVTDLSGNLNTASNTYTVSVSDISPVDSETLPDNGYRHNLVHLTGDYYVSSHTVTVPNTATDPVTMLDSEVTLRLYTITDGIIELIDSQVIQTNTQDIDTALHEFETEPKSTGLTRVDDDTIAISYVVGGTSSTVASSTVATYDVDTTFTTMMPFILSQSADFRTGTTGDQTHNHTLIAFDADRLVIAYSYPDSAPTGFMQVITIDPGTGVLAAGTPGANH